MVFGMEILVIAVLSICFFYYLSWNEDGKGDFWTKVKEVPGRTTKTKYIFMCVMTALVIAVGMFRLGFYGTEDMLKEIELVVMLMFLVPITWTDYHEHIIPNKLVFSGLILRLVFYVLEAATNLDAFLFDVKGDVIGMVFIIAVSLIGGAIIKGGIGYGDVKLLGLMALYQGISGMLSAVLLSLFVLFFIALYFLISKKKGKKDVLPFGPAAFAGTLLSMILTIM